MSYDLVFWKGFPTEEPATVWNLLAQGEDVRFVQPIGPGEAVDAFRAEFGAKVAYNVDDGEVLGPGFEFQVEKNAPYLHINCAFGLVEDEDDQGTLSKIQRAGQFRLGCQMFDPQTGEYAETTKPLTEGEKKALSGIPTKVAPAFAVGGAVAHKKFGPGTITALIGGGDKCQAQVKFDDGSERKLLTRFLTAA